MILAVPAGPTCRLLQSLTQTELAMDPLQRLRHASVALVHLGLKGAPLPAGFGFLVPPDEAGPQSPLALGVLFGSHQFPGRAPDGHSSASAIYRAGDVRGKSDDELTRQALQDLGLALGSESELEAVVSTVHHWDGVIPSYAPGHAQQMKETCREIEKQLPGMVLVGSYIGGVSVEDCLRRGSEAAGRIMSGTSSPETTKQ